MSCSHRSDGMYRFYCTPYLTSPQVLRGVCNSSSSKFHPIALDSSCMFNSSYNNKVLNYVSRLYQMWHHKFFHPHHETLKQFLKLCNVSIPNKQFPDFCNACCMSKVRRLPSNSSKTVNTRSLELIFYDLWGPSPVHSISGCTYFITFVDAHSRYTLIYPLKLKSDTLVTFVQFKALVELQLNLKIKFIQTDGEGELKPLTHLLTMHGITHKITCPHTHHRNGPVERRHVHVVETGLTLLAQANLP